MQRPPRAIPPILFVAGNPTQFAYRAAISYSDKIISDDMTTTKTWPSRGKTIAQLIAELMTFADQHLEVRISIDGGSTSAPISLVGKDNEVALLMNCEDNPSLRDHPHVG